MAGLTEIIKEAGIVGCGGAGFPTHAKYSGGPVETIIVNGAECEPLLQTDRYLMRNCARKLIRTADRIKEETGAKEFIIALKAAYTREIESLERAIEELGSSVKLHKLQSFFPAGDEQTIVYEVTGRVVPPAAIPLSVGCVVSNVATIYGIGDAFEGEPFTRKFLTVTGEVAHPTILRVPVGTPVSECIALAGGTHLSRFIVVNGGPMMGRAMVNLDSPVTKGCSGITVMSGRDAQRREATQCIKCAKCVSACPMGLEPYYLSKMTQKKGWDELEALMITSCIECGCCQSTCPAYLPLLDWVRLGKQTVMGLIRARAAAAPKK